MAADTASHTLNPFDLLSEVYKFCYLGLKGILKADTMRGQVDATARLALFLAYLTYTVGMLNGIVSLFSIRSIWKKLWHYSGYCADEMEWASIKTKLGQKMDGRSIEENKENLHAVLTQLRRHALYRQFSQYNYELPELLNRLTKASDKREFEDVRKELMESFAHTSWSLKGQIILGFRIGLVPISSFVIWFVFTIVLREVPL